MNTTAFAQLLRERRQELNYSQSKVAKLCYICKSTYNHYERGLRVPSLDAALKISHVLKLEPLTILKTLVEDDSRYTYIPLESGIIREDPPANSAYQGKYTSTFNQLDENKQKAILDIMDIMLSSDDNNLK